VCALYFVCRLRFVSLCPPGSRVQLAIIVQKTTLNPNKQTNLVVVIVLINYYYCYYYYYYHHHYYYCHYYYHYYLLLNGEYQLQV
jgi:hypothetical protein